MTTMNFARSAIASLKGIGDVSALKCQGCLYLAPPVSACRARVNFMTRIQTSPISRSCIASRKWRCRSAIDRAGVVVGMELDASVANVRLCDTSHVIGSCGTCRHT